MGRPKNYIERNGDGNGNGNENNSGLSKSWCSVCVVFSCIYILIMVAIPVIMVSTFGGLASACQNCPINSRCRYWTCLCNEGFYGKFCNITVSLGEQ